VGQDIDLAAYRGLPPPKASRLLNAWLQAHFTERLGAAGGYMQRAGIERLNANEGRNFEQIKASLAGCSSSTLPDTLAARSTRT
jgi:hypothetical protein